MVVDDFNIRGAGGVGGPLEADAPLLVDANRILPGAVSPERFQAIARQRRQIVDGRGGVQYVEALPALSREALERPHEFAVGKLFRASVPAAQDHGCSLEILTRYVNRQDKERMCSVRNSAGTARSKSKGSILFPIGLHDHVA